MFHGFTCNATNVSPKKILICQTLWFVSSWSLTTDLFCRPYTYASLNKQFVLLLSARGLPDKILIDKQKQYFVELNNLMKNRELQVLHKISTKYEAGFGFISMQFIGQIPCPCSMFVATHRHNVMPFKMMRKLLFGESTNVPEKEGELFIVTILNISWNCGTVTSHCLLFIQVRYLCAEGHYQLGERLLSGEEPDQDTEKILNEIILRPGKVKDYNDDNVLTRYNNQ